jgi:transposase
VLAACNEPGASVAGVALAYGLNANLVHNWRGKHGDGKLAPKSVTGEFVALALPVVAPPVAEPKPPVVGDIRIELRRGATAVTVNWPMADGRCRRMRPVAAPVVKVMAPMIRIKVVWLRVFAVPLQSIDESVENF